MTLQSQEAMGQQLWGINVLYDMAIVLGSGAGLSGRRDFGIGLVGKF